MTQVRFDRDEKAWQTVGGGGDRRVLGDRLVISRVPVTERATLCIPGTPKSFNQIGYRSHWAIGQREKQNWQVWFALALMEQKVPRKLKHVETTATLRFKQRRRRDSGNFRVILEKALGDALVEGGWLPDDTSDLYRFGQVELLAPCERPETILVLDYER